MAIAYQGSADLGSNGGSGTFTGSYTVNAASNLLIVGFLGDLVTGNDDITAVTYNGVSMTLIAKTTTGNSVRFSYLYALANPAAGANNVIITSTSSHYLLPLAADYSGASSTPDASTTFVQPLSGTVTQTIAGNAPSSNDWGILIGGCDAGTIAGGTGATLRTHDAAFNSLAILDTNGPVSGSYSMTWQPGASNIQTTVGAVISFANNGSSIAYEGSADLSNNGGGASPYTHSYTVNAASNMLIVAFYGDTVGGHDDITGVTYAGSSMTLVAKLSDAAQIRYLYIYALHNPATGANNVVVSYTSAHYIIMVGADYSNMSGTFPDNLIAATLNEPTTQVTTTANNCWGVAFGGNFGSSTFTATIGTKRVSGASFTDTVLIDTNGPTTPAGVMTLQWRTSTNSSAALTSIMASFAPGGGGGGGGGASNLAVTVNNG